jgi:cytochrome P450
MKLWFVTRYDEVFAGLRDQRLSSNRTGIYRQALPPEAQQRLHDLFSHVGKWLQLTDDPDHARLRKLVNAAFTPRIVNDLKPRILSMVETLLDLAPRGAPFDFLQQFCYPLPANVICEMLGIPLEQRDAFRHATDQLVRFSARGGPALRDHAETAAAALDRLIALFRPLIEERRRAPCEDLLSALVVAEADGERLTQEELYAMCTFLFLAGHETTTSALASGVYTLLNHPDQARRLRDDSERMVASAIEEILRFESPVPRAVREAKEELEIRGRTIRKGQFIVLLLGAANRDPGQFPDPDRFDIARQPNRHVAFGYGAHFCLGAALARLEMEIALRALSRRLPGLRLAAETWSWRPLMGLRCLTALPVIAA